MHFTPWTTKSNYFDCFIYFQHVPITLLPISTTNLGRYLFHRLCNCVYVFPPTFQRCFQLLTSITKRSILDVAAVLDPPLPLHHKTDVSKLRTVSSKQELFWINRTVSKSKHYLIKRELSPKTKTEIKDNNKKKIKKGNYLKKQNCLKQWKQSLKNENRFIKTRTV